MAQLPILSGKQIIKILKKIGYLESRQKGSHIRLECAERRPVTVPNYKSVDRSLLMKILRQTKLTSDEFIALAKNKRLSLV